MSLEQETHRGHLVAADRASVPPLTRVPAGRGTRWCLLFGLLFVVIGSWSLASPLFAYPDEAAHVIKAEAVVRGQLLGRDASTRRGRFVLPFRAVQVPGVLSNAGVTQVCYSSNLRQPASCAAPLRGPDHPVTLVTHVGAYPPLYYLVVGLPSLAAPGTSGIYLMRLLSGALSAAFLATALVTSLTSRRPRPRLLALFVVTTPLVLYMASAVNPSGLEITSAICLWASGLALTSGVRDDRRLLIWQVGISSVVLVSMRGLSPLWLVLIVLGLLVVADRSTLRDLARRADVRWWGAVIGFFTVLAAAWIIAAGATRLAGYTYPSSASTGYLWGQAVGSTWMWLKGLVGTVGLVPNSSLIDVHATVPEFVLTVWLLAVVALVAAAWPAGSRRSRQVVAALIAAYLVIPVALTVAEDRSVGPVWQSRYILPLVAGVPLIAAAMIADRDKYGRPWLDRAALVGVGLLGSAEILMFLANLRRFMVGVGGPIDFLHGPWQPPVPAALLVVVGVVAELSLVAFLGAMTTGSRALPDRSPARSPRPQPQ